MRPLKLVLMTFVLSTALLTAQSRKTLDIYSIDVEGGGATLFGTGEMGAVIIGVGGRGSGRSATAGGRAHRRRVQPVA